MTPTEELRKRLDELGIEWWQRKGHTCWNVKKDEGIELWRAWVAPNGTITLKTDAIYGLTPEQAIAATVGGTCELINAADDLGKGTSSCMCSKCGYTALDDWWDEFKHCPNCGAKVVSE